MTDIDPVIQRFFDDEAAEKKEFEALSARLAAALSASGSRQDAAWRALESLFSRGTVEDAHAADRLVMTLWDCAAGETYVKKDWLRLHQLVDLRFKRMAIRRASADW